MSRRVGLVANVMVLIGCGCSGEADAPPAVSEDVAQSDRPSDNDATQSQSEASDAMLPLDGEQPSGEVDTASDATPPAVDDTTMVPTAADDASPSAEPANEMSASPVSSMSEPMTSPFEGPDEPALPPDESEEVLRGDRVHPDAPFCPGFEASVIGLCETDADCGEQGQCFFENTPAPCDLGCAGPVDQCDDRLPCPQGFLCVGTPAAEISAPCACAGGRYCAALCGSDADCGSGMRCEADGSCQAVSCNDGYDCPEAQTCDADASGADEHGCRVLRCDEPGAPACRDNWVCDPAASTASGCVRKPCAQGADCDCGACSPQGNECVSRPGFCAMPGLPG